MTVLSDGTIDKRVNDIYDDFDIDPYVVHRLQPASYDIRLGNEFTDIIGTVNHITGEYVIDTHNNQTLLGETVESDELKLGPQERVLATTMEEVTIPNDVVAVVDGRSSLGRLFVSIHQTAGYIDAGFSGEITLEIVNHNPESHVRLYAGDRIGQIRFMKTDKEVLAPYGSEGLGSSYQNQEGAVPSGMNFE